MAPERRRAVALEQLAQHRPRRSPVRAGRAAPPAAAVRSPRSSTRARVRDRVWRSTQRRSAAEVRPATSSSAPGSAATARIDAAARGRAAASAASGPGRAGAPRAPSSSTRSSGESTSTASRRLAARSRTRTPAASSSQRGSALSEARSGRPREDLRRPRDGDRVRRVAVVRERHALVGRRGSHEGLAVAGRRQRHRARAEDDQAGRAQVADEPPEPGAERRVVGRLPADDDLGGAGRPGTPAGGARRAPPTRRRGTRSSGPASGDGSGARMRTVTGAMAPESSDGRAVDHGAGPGVHRPRGERRRRGRHAGRRRPRARGAAGCARWPACRGSTPRRPSASSTSPSSATRSSRSTCRRVRPRRPAPRRC